MSIRSQHFNEIMPAIYTRFMEKEARQWREIYKVRLCATRRLVHKLTSQQALQLLEYLIKNGSERVVDDARSHVGTVKMLRNFHYIDDKGKDQGINGARLFVCFADKSTHHGMTSCLSISASLLPCMFTQFATEPKRSLSYSAMLRKFAPSAEKPRRIALNTQAPVTMA
jgi:hypothetical protein